MTEKSGPPYSSDRSQGKKKKPSGLLNSKAPFC